MHLILHCKRSMSLSHDEILRMVDPHTLADIKRVDPDPLIVAYVIASEGDTSPSVIGDDGVSGGIVRWTRDAIYQLGKKIKRGIRLFAGHTEAQTPAEAERASERPAIAEVVGSALINADKAYQVVAAWFRPESRRAASQYDSVSIEVEFEHRPGPRGVMIVERVRELFGIALLRKDQRPAFEDARKVGVAYAEQHEDIQQHERYSMSLKSASWQELVDELKSRNLHIWQIASPEEVIGERKVLKNGAVVYTGKDREFTRWAMEFEEKLREELENQYKPKIEELSTKAKKAEEYERELARYQGIPVLQKKIAELPAGLQAVIAKKMDRFVPGDDPEKAADDFIAEYREVWEAANGSAARSQPAPSLGGSDDKGKTDDKEKYFGIEVDEDDAEFA